MLTYANTGFLRCRTAGSFLAAGLLLGGLCGGCKEKEPEIEIISLEGSVEKVDLRPDGTGTISVWYYNEKAGQETLGTGEVTAETEIMINGAAGKLADIKIGDRVRGDVRLTKTGNERTLTALKIIVERPEPVEPSEGG